MACRGCSQAGDCACVVVGDGSSIVVTGTGSAGDPYVVSFAGDDLFDTVASETPNVCTETLQVLAKRQDGTYDFIPYPKPCARIL